MTDNKDSIEIQCDKTPQKSLSYQKYLLLCIKNNNIDQRHFRLSSEEFIKIYNFSQKDFIHKARENYKLLYEDDYNIMIKSYNESLNAKIKNDKETNIQESIEIIMRQTDLSRHEAEEQLIECNYDYEIVIKNYLSTSSYLYNKGENCLNKDNNKNSINQKIYSEIRKHMDGVNYTK